MKLTDHVHVIGGGTLGYQISNDYDCNVYVLRGRQESVIIDSGAGIEPEALLRNLRADGIPLESISALILTHAHADHSGGAAALKEALSLRILAGVKTADILMSRDEERLSLPEARRTGVYPSWYRFCFCTVDRILQAGEAILAGEFTFHVIAAPGHSSDMIALYCPELKAFFGGDTIFQQGKLAIIQSPDFCMREYRDTIAAIAALDIKQLFPGHLNAVLQDADSCIAEANRLFEQGENPGEHRVNNGER